MKQLSFWAFAQLVTTFIHSQLEIIHVLNGPTAQNQHRCRGPKSNIDMICAKETGKTQTFNHDLTRPANVYRPKYLTTFFEIPPNKHSNI